MIGDDDSSEKTISIVAPIAKIENKIEEEENITDQEELDPKQIMEQNNKYFTEFTKLYEANQILKSQLNSLMKEKNTLKHSVQKLENKHLKKGNEKIEINDMYTNRRRKRRTKNEIKRNFICPEEICKKSYGSEGSLNQHIKLKHKNYNI